MKIGYPCLNRTLGCQGNKTFRLKSYSESRLIEAVNNNLSCLLKILRFNLENRILFFRITSDLIPFASHPICKFKWQLHFKDRFKEIGRFIKKHRLRISMHPDQFTLINSINEEIFNRSRRELLYHARVLDLMGLGPDAKIQIHIGGVYGDKPSSIKRFISRFNLLDMAVRRRLVIENDDLSYTLKDCLLISRKTNTPVLFDIFHHSLNSSGESVTSGIKQAQKTWRKKDGILMVDYSNQRPLAKPGSHAESLDTRKFKKFLKETKAYNFDIMLEIKDKEKSALKALAVLPKGRFL